VSQWFSVLWQSLASLFRASADQPYRILFDGMADPTFVLDASTHRFLHANPAAEELLGYTRHEFASMTPLDLHPAEEQEAVQQRLDDEEDRGAHQYRARAKDGSIIPVEVHSNPVSLDGRPAYVSVMRDLSEREAERRRTADLARLVAEAPTPMLRLANNGAVLYANEAARSLLSYAEDGTPLAPRPWSSWVRDALRADQTMQTEANVGDRTCLLTFVPYADRHYVNIYSLDITDRVRAVEQLRQERDLAEGLVNTAPAVVLVLTPDGRVVRANTYTESLLGESADEIAGCDWMATFVPEEERQAAHNALQRAADGEIVAGHRNRIRTRGGDTRLIEWYTATLRGARAGIVEGTASCAPNLVLAIGHDVTEREQLETRLRLAQKMEAVGQLAGGIAHDFNNLLQVINGNVEFLLMEPSLSERCQRDVAEVKQAGARAAELTAQLLAYSRRQAVRLTSVDLCDLLRHMSSMLARTLGERIRVTLEVQPYHSDQRLW
jgi:two-component system, cell cycle sensor histidine kinase and response regulator CckA